MAIIVPDPIYMCSDTSLQEKRVSCAEAVICLGRNEMTGPRP